MEEGTKTRMYSRIGKNYNDNMALVDRGQYIITDREKTLEEQKASAMSLRKNVKGLFDVNQIIANYAKEHEKVQGNMFHVVPEYDDELELPEEVQKNERNTATIPGRNQRKTAEPTCKLSATFRSTQRKPLYPDSVL